MWCDPPSISPADIIQPSQSNSSMPFSSSSEINEKKQLSFIYQPGIGLYDKKQLVLDQDLRITSTTTDVDERIQSLELSPSTSSTFSFDVDHRRSSPLPNLKSDNLYKSYLRRQNEQNSLPIRQKLFSSDDILSDKNSSHYHIKLFDINISTNQENNHQKRKLDQNLFSNKKFRQSSSSITKYHSWSNEQKQLEILSNENSKCEKNLLDEEINRQKAKLITTKQQSSPIKFRSNLNERLQKQSIIKNIPLIKKSSFENQKAEKEIPPVPSQGLLLCPKEEPLKKKKTKKKIAPTISSSTELLDDDPVLDSILFNEMQSVQQQWKQFLILTMEKELHINPSDGKKKFKQNKFHRTNEFLLAYENLYDFEGMKHWNPLSR